MRIPGFNAEMALVSDGGQGRYAGLAQQAASGQVQLAINLFCLRCIMAGGDCICNMRGCRCG